MIITTNIIIVYDCFKFVCNQTGKAERIEIKFASDVNYLRIIYSLESNIIEVIICIDFKQQTVKWNELGISMVFFFHSFCGCCLCPCHILYSIPIKSYSLFKRLGLSFRNRVSKNALYGCFPKTRR